MKPIPGVGLKAGGNTPRPTCNSTGKQFSKALTLVKAGGLLRPTGQYKKWIQICQKNDVHAEKLGNVLLERHELLNQSRHGKKIDKSLFDDLTRQLKENNILLFDYARAARQHPEPSQTGPSDNIDSRLATRPQPAANPGGPEKKERGNPVIAEHSVVNEADTTTGISDESLLVISAEYKSFILDNGLIGYGDAKKLLLPLSDTSRSLDFSIDVDADKGTASGWFIDEGRTFNLDLSKGRAVIDGKTVDLPGDGIEAANGEIYVDSRVLSKWFPVNFEYDFSTQSVRIDPREKLPFQARIEREKAWKNIGGSQANRTVFPRKDSEYELFSVPSVDFSITGGFTDGNDDKDEFTTDFSILSKGDLGKMTSEIYLSGDEKDELKETRFTLKKEDPDGNLIGPLKATSVAVGDIRTIDLPVIGGGGTEKGFRISNKELRRTREFDTTFFEGNLAPGWDVEVYRNKILIDSTRVGADGRYSFNDIPIYYGNNDFKLVFYGPQGQKREETKRINVGNDLLKPGMGEYNLSLSQKNTSLFDPDKTSDYPDEDSIKLNAAYDYGINESLSVGTGISSQEISGERHDYLNIGAKGNFEGIYLGGDILHDTKGGNALELLTQTTVGEIDLRLKQRFYDSFVNGSGSGSSDPLKSQTNLSASGVIPKNFLFPDIPYNVTFQETNREDSTRRTISSRLAGSIKGVSLNNYLQWMDFTSSTSEDLSLIEGSLQGTTQFGDFRIRGQLDYELDPVTEIERAEISNTYAINEHLSSELSLKKDMDGDGAFGGSFGLNWNNGKYILSPQISYDSNDEFSAFLSFSTSFGMEPRSKTIQMSSAKMADKGGASVRAFNDKNNNKVFDQGDELIKGASVKAVQSYREAVTDENGVAYLDMLEKYKPTDIMLDTDTLEDPFWEPSTQSHSIVPRPGHVEIMEIPVVATGEVDGAILVETKDGKEKPLPNVRVELLDEKGAVVQQVWSEYDGFYYFQKVFPGKYSVRIGSDTIEKIGKVPARIDVEIDQEGTIAGGRDIFLKKESVAESRQMPDKQPAAATDTEEVKTDGTNVKQVATADPEIPPEKESAEIVEADVKKRPDKKETVAPVPGHESLKKDYQKLKADYDRLVELERKSQETDEPVVSAVSPLKRTAKQKDVQQSLGVPKYGLHLSSYRTPEKATAGITYLMDKYKKILNKSDFTIKKVKVSDEKGTWFRVIAGSFADNETALKLRKKIKRTAPYCNIISLNSDAPAETDKGVHLTSFRTRKKALLSIQELKAEYPSLLKNTAFTIQNVDLGPRLGKWKRVVAGRFKDGSDAELLAEHLKMKRPYCKIMEIEKENEFGVHMASYRTLGKASDGLKLLQKKHHSLISNEDFSIRRVNLGNGKGTWYRIFAGRFPDKDAAISLKNSLRKENQYANILKFSL